MSWKNRMKRNNRKMRTSLLAAGFLSCTLLTCAGGAYCMRHTAYALEQAEADAALDMVQSEDLTEGEYDELISNVVHSAVDAVSTDETETEGMLLSILPQKVKDTLNSLDADQITEDALIIQRVLTNPDVQDMLQYKEVQDLLVTLVHNALNTAQNDPVMTEKILETLGVDRRVILLFYEILRERRDNPETVKQIQEFITSDDGGRLMAVISKTLDPEIIDRLLNEFDSSSQSMVEILDIAKTVTSAGLKQNVAMTESEAGETEAG